MLHGRISLKSVLLVLLLISVNGFNLELMYISLIISIRSKPPLSPRFSAACASAIVHRNHFFCLYQQNKSSESKVKFRQDRLVIVAKRFLKLLNLHMLMKQKKAETWLSGLLANC